MNICCTTHKIASYPSKVKENVIIWKKMENGDFDLIKHLYSHEAMVMNPKSCLQCHEMFTDIPNFKSRERLT